MNGESQKVQIFLSYASEDEEKVKELYKGLSERGYYPWMDKEKLVGGQNWKLEIKKAIRASNLFLVCISKNSVYKRSFLQEEIKEALEIFKKKLPDDIYMIPVRLENIKPQELPYELEDIQLLDWFVENFWEELEKAVNKAIPNRITTKFSEEEELKSLIIRHILGEYTRSRDTFFDDDKVTRAVCEEKREDGSPRFHFTEATGYAILDSILLYSVTGDNKYLQEAGRCAKWIIKAKHECGGVRTRFYFEHDKDKKLLDMSFSGGKIFSFDTAICLKALTALYPLLPADSQLRDDLLASARYMANFLTGKMIQDNGMVYAVYDTVTGKSSTEKPQRWSQQPGAFHARVAEALVDFDMLTKEEQYREKAEAVCCHALDFQLISGNFETSPGRTELHPHCYAAEGLLHVGRSLQNEQFIQAARRATEWALDNCQNGEIAQVFDLKKKETSFRFRTDALAQTLALAADLFHIGQMGKDYLQKMDELARKILEMRKDSSYFDREPGNTYFRYGYYEKKINDTFEAKTLSYWTNMFCIRGLYKYHLAKLLDQTCVIILAGGKGSRSWPISCEIRPKPFSYSLLGDRSLIQETIRRYTHHSLLKPGQIYIVCSEMGLLEARKQISEEGVPVDNIISEKVSEGTIPALYRAIESLPQNKDKNRLVIVSMADNVIEPYGLFQNSLITALFITNEEECFASVGKPVDLKNKNNRDSRFGHMSLQDQSMRGIYPVHGVVKFKEKPTNGEWEALLEQSDNHAWECGTIIFQEQYYKKVAPTPPQGDLTKDLLEKTGDTEIEPPVKMVVSLLDDRVRFEDFGVPGRNLQKFFRGSEIYDKGNENICLGTRLKTEPKHVRLLCCKDNLIISDQLPITIDGVEGYLVIDSAIANTTVIMPLKEAHELPNFHQRFFNSDKFKPFAFGDRTAAKETEDDGPSCRESDIVSDFGLAVGYKCQNIILHRSREGVCIHDKKYPKIEPADFQNLEEKQEEDPKLVQHLFHVTALAESLIGGDIVLTDTQKKVLALLCLYHDYGGLLSKNKIEEEKEILDQFEKVSKLDRRLLDSRIIAGILNLQPDNKTINMLNDSVNSAVELLKSQRRFDIDKPVEKELRDILVFLLQVQDRPDLFVQFKENYPFKNFKKEWLDSVFALLKISEIFSNGRWLYKRNNPHEDQLDYDKKNIPLEEFPFTIAFVIRSLNNAKIEPGIYVERLNEVLKAEDSPFMKIISKLQEKEPLLVCDELYQCLISHDDPLNKMKSILNGSIKNIFSVDTKNKQNFQLAQIRDLPANLEVIRPTGCQNITEESIEEIKDIISDFFHKNRSILKEKTPEKDITAFLAQQPKAPKKRRA